MTPNMPASLEGSGPKRCYLFASGRCKKVVLKTASFEPDHPKLGDISKACVSKFKPKRQIAPQWDTDPNPTALRNAPNRNAATNSILP